MCRPAVPTRLRLRFRPPPPQGEGESGVLALLAHPGAGLAGGDAGVLFALEPVGAWGLGTGVERRLLQAQGALDGGFAGDVVSRDRCVFVAHETLLA